jgi:hypothetical protein
MVDAGNFRSGKQARVLRQTQMFISLSDLGRLRVGGLSSLSAQALKKTLTDLAGAAMPDATGSTNGNRA